MGKLRLVLCPSLRTSVLLRALSEAGYDVHHAPEEDPAWLAATPDADVVVEQRRAHLVHTLDPIVIAGQAVTPETDGTPLPVLLRMTLQAQQRSLQADLAQLEHLTNQASSIHDVGNVLAVVFGAVSLLLQHDHLRSEHRDLVKGIREFALHGQLVARRLLHGAAYASVLVDVNEVAQ